MSVASDSYGMLSLSRFIDFDHEPRSSLRFKAELSMFEARARISILGSFSKKLKNDKCQPFVASRLLHTAKLFGLRPPILSLAISRLLKNRYLPVNHARCAAFQAVSESFGASFHFSH